MNAKQRAIITCWDCKTDQPFTAAKWNAEAPCDFCSSLSFTHSPGDGYRIIGKKKPRAVPVERPWERP